MNELWKLDKGWIAGYMEDKDLIRRVKRHKKDWKIIADYIKYGRLIGVHFKIPIEQAAAGGKNVRDAVIKFLTK
ncbi:hypothetical protein AAHB36_06125 [Bacillus velezensis]